MNVSNARISGDSTLNYPVTGRLGPAHLPLYGSHETINTLLGDPMSSEGSPESQGAC
jgi:hypothetical protein